MTPVCVGDDGRPRLKLGLERQRNQGPPEQALKRMLNLESQSRQPTAAGPGRRSKPAPRRGAAFLSLFMGLMVVWVLLSGRLDAFHLGLGVFCSLLVSFLCADLFADHFDLKRLMRALYGHISYLPWLIYQILLANLHVLKLALHPKMYDKLDPHLVRFHTRLEGQYSQTSFAQSITLTPGTITVRVLPDGVFIVHAIDGKSGDKAALRDMESRVAKTFGED